MINILEKKVDRISIINNIYVYSYLLCVCCRRSLLLLLLPSPLLLRLWLFAYFFTFVSLFLKQHYDSSRMESNKNHAHRPTNTHTHEQFHHASKAPYVCIVYYKFLGMERWIASCCWNRIQRIYINTNKYSRFLKLWAMSHTHSYVFCCFFFWECVCFSF